MATRRTTHGKRERERSKQQKAAAKRERRQDRSPDDPDEIAQIDDDGDDTTEELLERMKALHADYDDGRVSFEDFDEQRAELMDRIAIRLAQ